MYQPISPFGLHVSRYDGFRCAITFVPGGARGILLKSKFPKRYACADKVGLHLAERNRFNVISACSINLSHCDTGKSGSTVASPALKWYLNVCIDRSVKFARWLCGGTS